MELEEMINDIKEIQPFFYGSIAEMFIEKGYRKESDTARDIIKLIKRNGTLGFGGYIIHDSTVEQICKKYGIE